MPFLIILLVLIFLAFYGIYSYIQSQNKIISNLEDLIERNYEEISKKNIEIKELKKIDKSSTTSGSVEGNKTDKV